MAELEKYLYCIIPCQEERTFDVAAIGSEESIVHTVCHEGLAVVVSDSPVKQYESTRQNMMAHEKVLETIMREFTLLPVRFGTVTDSSSPLEDIKKLLSVKFEEFNRLLRDMEGKVELGLKAFWRDEKAIFEEIVAENAEIRRLRNSLSGKSAAATHFDRIRLGEMVKKAMDRKRAKEADKILLPLRQVAYKIRENEVLADRMVVNAAFLVDRNRVPDFDQAVNNLDEQLGKRIALKYVGPAPPYNFVNIVVSWQEIR
ncbi:MAG: GvpL/GvpF family gas vesicle protein [Coprothermobacterota bacterium]|nr:GvpL/GvpF family gas vesicle protein [Coprothermobacterota bacterium]